ncbi:MAG: family integrating conjugative element protein [Gammaproteobacteria bacterium]|nr:family integrating conjugative element protein [Gammaproteobacteria bacterium]
MKRIFYVIINFFLVTSSFTMSALAKEETKEIREIKKINEMPVSAIPYEHAVWNKIPISFVVPVNQERMLIFPGKIDFKNLDARLTMDKVSILNNDGTLYVQAKQPFPAIRVPITLKETGHTILVDISADPHADDTPLEVVLPSENENDENPRQTSDVKKNSSEVIHYVTLLRYAIQHLYAPERLIIEDNRISRSPMYTTRSIDLFYNKNVIAMPLLSWCGGNYTVTAILIKNNENHVIELDPRQIRGQWLAASFYPTNQLKKAGTTQDRTTLFLLSDRPFQAALTSLKSYEDE